MNIKEFIKENITVLDGGMGSILQSKGLTVGELPERWNIIHPEIITGIHKDYLCAGSDIITTNTFGLNGIKYKDDELEAIAAAAVLNARRAINACGNAENKYIAFDIGPCGKMLKPWGDYGFEEAVKLFKRLGSLAEKNGADAVIIETMNDSFETKAALLGVKENCSLPVFVSNVYNSDGRLLTGADAAAMVSLLEGMGADYIGANCSLGPAGLKKVASELLKYASVPVFIQPNAGLPKSVDGRTVYDVLPAEFAGEMSEMADLGVNILGGCCGTDASYIRAVKKAVNGKSPLQPTEKCFTCCSSYSKTVFFDEKTVVIGERINPTGKKALKKAIENGETDYILKEGLAQEDAGADILDINAGVPGVDEAKKLAEICFELQAVTGLPLQIDSSNLKALEKALRIYNGKPVINSVNASEESMNAIFPLAKKYGGLIVCLCLDENGIPKDAAGRLAAAEKIVRNAKAYGIRKRDLIFDALTLPVSADINAAKTTLESIKLISSRLGVKTVLGLSNISFGLPDRDKINSEFLSLAMANGLSAAIINPLSSGINSVLKSHNALMGLDKNFEGYIAYTENIKNNSLPASDMYLSAVQQQAEAASSACSQKPSSAVSTPPQSAGGSLTSDKGLQNAIVRGLKKEAETLCCDMLKKDEGLFVIKNEIIPALDIVGKAFEEKRMYLPQLLLSAEAAQAAFEIIKRSSSASDTSKGEPFVIATVKGDIHDIGKNIVKLLLSNYGFNVTDLGKDVAPKLIADAVKRTKSRLCGLSALMTTTVPAMEETIKLLRKETPECIIIAGGAVLTKEYADKIGADYYASDAMATVRIAQSVIKG